MKRISPALIVAALVANACAQTPAAPPAAPAKTGTIHFRTTLGSFKFINGSGKVSVSFTGSFLVSGLQGTVSTSGNLRKEYDEKNRQVYFGTGTIVVNGQFRALQWFGRNMQGDWTGNGRARFVGEFDRNLKTGEFWYDNNPEREQWGTFREVDVPPQIAERPKPIDRSKVKKGGGNP